MGTWRSMFQIKIIWNGLLLTHAGHCTRRAVRVSGETHYRCQLGLLPAVKHPSMASRNWLKSIILYLLCTHCVHCLITWLLISLSIHVYIGLVCLCVAIVLCPIRHNCSTWVYCRRNPLCKASACCALNSVVLVSSLDCTVACIVRSFLFASCWS